MVQNVKRLITTERMVRFVGWFMPVPIGQTRVSTRIDKYDSGVCTQQIVRLRANIDRFSTILRFVYS